MDSDKVSTPTVRPISHLSDLINSRGVYHAQGLIDFYSQKRAFYSKNVTAMSTSLAFQQKKRKKGRLFPARVRFGRVVFNISSSRGVYAQGLSDFYCTKTTVLR